MMPADARSLIVVGASVRAMAASAVRAGFRVFAADLFGDHDLRGIADDVATIRPYPEGIPEAIARFPCAPLLYTGALENHPTLLSGLAACRPLTGSSPEAVARVRNPDVLAHEVCAAGLWFPDTRRDPTGLPTDGTWLVKPTDSAGGRSICLWDGEDVGAVPTRPIWQKRIAGHRLSVGYVMTAGFSRLVAASHQLVGRRWCRSGPFAYCGSIDLDPDAFGTSLRHRIMLLGNTLAERFRLVGLVGADIILDSSGRVYVIEINPRPTASLELAERATGFSLAASHLAASGIGSLVPTILWRRSGTWAKAVLFAARDINFDSLSLEAVRAGSEAWTLADGWPALADIPEPTCPIPQGAPVCTVFAHAGSPRAALVLLRHRVAAIESLLAA